MGDAVKLSDAQVAPDAEDRSLVVLIKIIK
jgi:hypothetical protein